MREGKWEVSTQLCPVSRYRYVQVPIWPVPDRSDVRNLQFTTSYIILVSA